MVKVQIGRPCQVWLRLIKLEGGSIFMDSREENPYIKTFVCEKDTKKISHTIWFVSNKTIGGTKEGQLDTKQHKENKITLKSSFVVFFIRLFIVHRCLKNTLGRQQEKGTNPVSSTLCFVVKDCKPTLFGVFPESMFVHKNFSTWEDETLHVTTFFFFKESLKVP